MRALTLTTALLLGACAGTTSGDDPASDAERRGDAAAASDGAARADAWRPGDGAVPDDGALPGDGAPPDDDARPASDGAPPDDDARPASDGAPPDDDARPASDGALPPLDGAPPPFDGAPPVGDARPASDGAPPPRDAAPPPLDGAPPPRDGAPPPRDAAPPPLDGAPPPLDAAPPPIDPGPAPTLDPLPAADPPGAVETVVSRDGFTDDFLYGPDGLLKIGTRREWGGSIVFWGLAGAGAGINGSNAVDSNDTGREVQVAFYDPDRAMQGCAHDASCRQRPDAACPTSIRYLGWNPVQGGNRCNLGSGVDTVDLVPGRLETSVHPLHWNPDWARVDCSGDACGTPDGARRAEVRYTQRLRFVHSHIVEIRMEVVNEADLDHAVTLQEMPTVYATYGARGTADLYRLIGSDGADVPIDVPANDGFFMKDFQSPGGWVTLQSERLEYGVGLYHENRLTDFQGWQRRGTFNNFRARFAFGLPARGVVVARAYLLLGSLDTVRGLAAWLDARLAPFGVLDTPVEQAALGARTHVAGWVLDNRPGTRVAVRLDGALLAEGPAEGDRADVCRVWPGYPACPRVGYAFDVDTAAVGRGEHLLTVEATDADGNTRRIARAVVRR